MRFAGHRRAAHWQAFGVERLPGALSGTSAHEPGLVLPRASEAEEIAADYAGLGLSLGRHPLEPCCVRASSGCACTVRAILRS